MKIMNARVKQIRRQQRGGALILALIFMFYGSLVIGGMLTYLDASMLAQARAEDRMNEDHAGQAAIETLAADLLKEDTDPGNHTPGVGDWGAPLAFNGETVQIEITAVDDQSPSYIDYTVEVRTVDDGELVANCEIHQNLLWMGETCVKVTPL